MENLALLWKVLTQWQVLLIAVGLLVVVPVIRYLSTVNKRSVKLNENKRAPKSNAFEIQQEEDISTDDEDEDEDEE